MAVRPIIYPADFESIGIPQPHSSLFLRMAIREQTIIMVRAPGRYVHQLLMEGYASKGYHNKAKSSNWGLMAGFVMADANLSKASFNQRSLRSQRNALASAFREGAFVTSLAISLARREWLLDRGIVTERNDVTARAWAANFGHLANDVRFYTPVFTLDQQNGDRYADLRNYVFALTPSTQGGYHVWYAEDATAAHPRFAQAKAIIDSNFRLDHNPRKAMVYNSQIPRYKYATAADFDLFAVWKKRNLRYRNILENPALHTPELVARVQRLEDAERAKDYRPTPSFYLNGFADMHHFEDPELGNITPRLMHLKDTLNAAFKRDKNTKYQIGNLIHHSDEGGRPATNGIEDTIVCYIPNNDRNIIGQYGGNIIAIDCNNQNAAGIADFQIFFDFVRPTYRVNLNPSWVNRSDDSIPYLLPYSYRQYLIQTDPNVAFATQLGYPQIH